MKGDFGNIDHLTKQFLMINLQENKEETRGV